MLSLRFVVAVDELEMAEHSRQSRLAKIRFDL